MLSQTVCPHADCRLPLTWSALTAYYVRQLAQWLRRAAVTRCPGCRTVIPLSASTCPRCGVAITVGLATHATLAPVRSRWGRFWGGMSPRTWQWIRWLAQAAYLLLSAAVLWHLIAGVRYNEPVTLLLRAALTPVYAAVLVLLSLWVIPRDLQKAIARHTFPLVRIGLVLNFLAALLLLQALIGAWWLQALILAALFGLTCLAAWVLAKIFWPRVRDVRRVFAQAHQESFNPSEPQGRQADLD